LRRRCFGDENRSSGANGCVLALPSRSSSSVSRGTLERRSYCSAVGVKQCKDTSHAARPSRASPSWLVGRIRVRIFVDGGGHG
jgi:hypothetical protein